jgi:hypothetical protein
MKQKEHERLQTAKVHYFCTKADGAQQEGLSVRSCLPFGPDTSYSEEMAVARHTSTLVCAPTPPTCWPLCRRDHT